MKLNKRLAGLLVATMALSTVPQVAWASDYENHWAAQAIDKWKDKGILNGFEDGTFRPKEVVTKAQFAKILVELFGYTEVEGAKQYKDVPEGKWYSNYITKISAAGVMHEVGEAFYPNAAITREEATYALANAYKMMGEQDQTKTFKDQSQISTWALEAVAGLYEAGYIKGTPEGNFNPKGSLARAEMITMLDRINSEVINTKGTYSQDVQGNLVVNTRDVVLKDMTITGNLYLAEGIGDGDIDLENVKVEGKMFVEGGGINSIRSKNCHYWGSVQVSAKNPVRVVVEGDGVRIEALEGTQVTLTGNFKEVTVAQDVNMIIKDAKVETVVIAKGTNEEGAAPKIEITAGTKVDKIQADIAADIKGSGKVGELIANVSDVKIEQKPDKVTIGEKDVVVNVAGKDQSQTTTTSGNSNSSSSSDSNKEESLSPTYRISGTVYAQQKVGEQLKEVAEGATVKFYQVLSDGSERYVKYVYTDSKGAYSVNLDSGKTYRMEVWMEDGENNGYFYTKVLSPLKSNLDAYTVIMEQFPVANITVVDLNNRPVRDVKIVPIMDGREDGGSYTWYDGSAVRYLWGDDETVFNFDLYLGDTKIVPAEAIKNITVGEVKEQCNYRKDLKIQLPYTIPSTIVGQLVSEDKEVLKNYPVRLTKRQFFEDENGWGTDWVSEITTTTDEEGNFIFKDIDTDLAEGEFYTLRVDSRTANGNSYSADSSGLSLYGLQANNNQIKLQQTYGVTVKVIDKDRKPIKDAKVEISATLPDSAYRTGAETDRSGIADIHNTYIQPTNNTLLVSYEGQSVVTNIEMTPGKYNYEKVVQLENVSISGKVATIKLDELTTTIGGQTIVAEKVGIEGTQDSQWADINASGEVTMVVPENYNEDLTLYVIGQNGEYIYREKINIPEDQFSKTIKLSETPRYSITGEVRLTTSQPYEIATGASIQVNMNSWSNTPIAPIMATTSTEKEYELPNLLSSASYIVTASYERDGKKYIGRRHFGSKTMNKDEIEDVVAHIYLSEAASVSIKFQDNKGKALSNQSVYIDYVQFTTDSKGNVKYEGVLNSKVSVEAVVYIDGKRYEVKQIKNMTNDTVVDGNTIQLEKDMNLVAIVE